MSEYFFGLGPGHLPESADKIARKHGACLVNFTEPNGEKRHWFAGPNRGSPFDGWLRDEVMADLADETTPYQLDADMMGSEFCGALGDLHRFREILAAQCERPIETLVLNQHVSQRPGAEEPSEHDWNTAIETFAEECPELWRT